MTELYDALEACLAAMERGASLDSALERYPEIAQQLRPLLTASLIARGAGRMDVPQDVRRRARTRVLREAAAHTALTRSTPRRVISLLPRMALTLGFVAVLALTSTGLVSASSAALPGQQLYPVKRTWESVRLWFVISPEQRDLLESDYEQERLDEIYQLLGRQLSAPISFSGLLARQSDGKWLISGIPVSVTGSTRLPVTAISQGAPVLVIGTTRPDGAVDAQEIRVLQPGSSLPPFEPSEGREGESEGPAAAVGPAGAIAPPPASVPATPQSPAHPESARVTYQFSGVVQSMQDGIWRINGQPVSVDTAQITGTIRVGSIVRFQGYYDSEGQFNVTTLEPRVGSSDSGSQDSGSGSDGSGSGASGGGGDSGGGDDSGEKEGP